MRTLFVVGIFCLFFGVSHPEILNGKFSLVLVSIGCICIILFLGKENT